VVPARRRCARSRGRHTRQCLPGYGTRYERAADGPAAAVEPARRRILDTAHRLSADAELPHALVEIVGGPGYRGSPFINAGADR
jgi:hypothetical protein